jgi:carbonic anhydrase
MATSSPPTPYRIDRVPRTFIAPLPVPNEQILWIGCSDNGWAETQTLDMLPEEFIVHRNAGCVVSNEDLSTASTVEWAVRVSKVTIP